MKERPMRRVICTLMMLGLTSPAVAADLDVLRGSDVVVPPAPTMIVGPATFTRWSGFYVGGQVGYTNGNADLSGATQSGLAYATRVTSLGSSIDPAAWPVLGTANTGGVTFGGFFGYNVQWQDLILGAEANFSRAMFALNAPSSPIGRLTPGDSSGTAYSLTLTGNGSVSDLDFGTLRARAGYVVGNFLPYGFAGVAVGVANVNISANLKGEQYFSGQIGNCSMGCGPVSFTGNYTANAAVLYGFTVGGGVDWALASNFFLRAEFEWDQFRPPPGFLLTIATGRLGAGFKF
jgi:opacity protein-like surface antigen